jgi:hypothetical protein
MTVTFRTIKYKHREQSMALLAKFEAEEIEEWEVNEFVLSLVQSWDYIDPDTQEPVPVGDMGELTMEQYNDLMEEFNRQMGENAGVKKTNGSPSQFGSMGSKTKGKQKPGHRRG